MEQKQEKAELHNFITKNPTLYLQSGVQQICSINCAETAVLSPICEQAVLQCSVNVCITAHKLCSLLSAQGSLHKQSGLRGIRSSEGRDYEQ